MKITIKLKYTSDYDITPLQKQYTSVVHYAYNRLLEDKAYKEIYWLCKNMNHIELIDVNFMNSAINDATTIFKTTLKKDTHYRKVIFGGRKNFEKRTQGKITNGEWKDSRMLTISSKSNKKLFGNQKFRLDVINNNQIIFKLNKKEHYNLKLTNLKPNERNILDKLELLANDRNIPLFYQLCSDYICIIYDLDFVKEQETSNFPKKQNRVLGLDLNPNNIGISISDFDSNNFQNVIFKESLELSKLTSNGGKTQNKHNKLKNETIECAIYVANLCKRFNVGNIVVENLKDIPQKVCSRIKEINRLTINKWCYNIFIEKLTKYCCLYKINILSVYPWYSSIIGNLQHKSFDPVNSSIEISRRGYQCYIMKEKALFYPPVKIKESALNRWKKEMPDKVLSFDSWKEVNAFLKNSKMGYRVSLENSDLSKVLRFRSHHSKVKILEFG